MLSSFRDRFGTAGLVVAIIALVVALAGGAVAATDSSSGGGKATASAAKGKPGPRGKTGKTGKTGPAGPAGPQGPAGANGKDGANGSNGSNGAAGPTGPTGDKGKNGTNGFDGEVGPTGPTGTFGGIPLQAGVTQTGYWAFSMPGTQTIKDGDEVPVTVGSSEARVAISYPARITSPELYEVRFQGDPSTPQPPSPDKLGFDEACGSGTGGPGGTAANPKALPGFLCVWKFAEGLVNAKLHGICSLPSAGPCSPGRATRGTGALMSFESLAEGPASGGGTWAITGQ
jgi:hypothetical protein